MTRFKAAAVGALAIALAAAPVASAFANGNGWRHHGHGNRHYYGNPLAPVVGLAAAVVGTAAAIVTLPFAILGAAAARAPAYYAPGPGAQNYYPQQGYAGNGGPGYAPAPAYYPPPAASYYVPPAVANSYPPRAPSQYYAPPPARSAEYDGYRGNRGYPSSAGYYAQDGGPNGGNYAPRQRSYGNPHADYSYSPPNQH